MEDTLVVWGGEFGRTPMVQGGSDGRDHHNRCFTMWLAVGGLKRGHVHGATDDLGFKAASRAQQTADGTKFVHDWKVNPPQSCSGCHR